MPHVMDGERDETGEHGGERKKRRKQWGCFLLSVLNGHVVKK